MTASASKKLLVLLAGAALLALPAYAGKTDMQTLNVAPAPAKPVAKATDVDFTPLENAGLYAAANEGGLGKGLWKDTRRSALVTLLEDMPVASRNPTVQRLVFGALLSKSDSSLINNDIPIEPGHDLLTLRLEKLIQAGAYRQAQDLYSSFEDLEPYHENLARAGILAMMLNGEKSLACVEANTSKNLFPESEFIKQILAFCDITLSDAPSEESKNILTGLKLSNLDFLTSPDARMTYNPDNFSKLSLIEKSFLAAQGKIDFENSRITDLKKIPSSDIRLLLTDDRLTAKNRFLLTAEAENWGLAIPGELLDLYKATVPPAGGIDYGSLQVPGQAEDWEKIAYYYTIATNTEDKEAVWPALRAGLDAGNKFSTGSLKPYAPALVKISPRDATIDELETGVRVMISAGQPLPESWQETVQNLPVKSSQDIENKKILALKTAIMLHTEEEPAAYESVRSKISNVFSDNPRSGYLLNNIIENVDKRSANSDNAFRIYEKEFGLTFKQDYVMPSLDVWNRLLEASQRSNTGETVLLGASVLQVGDAGFIYPPLLNDTLKALNSVGLTDLSTDIAIAAVLGTVQTN